MDEAHYNIKPLLDSVKINEFYVTCRFKCSVKGKTIVSVVPFEPFEGKIEFTWKEILFHPLKSYNRYYHTPIRIYGENFQHTIVLKAFNKVANNFKWDNELRKFIAI
jgi:hypothetical protein